MCCMFLQFVYDLCVSGKLTIAKSKFQEEFPELAAGADDKAIPQKDESKELQYGPGPSLRPQSTF
jgi:hypothetical protein